MDSDTVMVFKDRTPPFLLPEAQTDTESTISLWQGGLNFNSTQSYICTVLYALISYKKNKQTEKRHVRVGADTMTYQNLK